MLLTRPLKLRQTATNLDNVKRSPGFDGKIAVKSKVKRLEDDDKTVTTPVSVSSKDT